MGTVSPLADRALMAGDLRLSDKLAASPAMQEHRFKQYPPLPAAALSASIIKALDALMYASRRSSSRPVIKNMEGKTVILVQQNLFIMLT
jgi:hypothetical protein